MGITATINQQTQLGQESSFLAGGSAGKKIESLSWTPTDKNNNTLFTPLGHRHTTENAVEKQWATWAVDQPVATFQEVLYLYENLFGHVSATTPSMATNSRLRTYSPSLTGSITPKSLVLQQGDANNVNVWTGVACDGFTKKWSRDGIMVSATAFSSTKSTGGTFTSTPALLGQTLQLGNTLNFYLDTTYGGLGGTQITKTVLDAEFDLKNMRTPYFDCNTATPSVADFVDSQPTTEFKMTLIENSVTRGIVAQQGITQYLQVSSISPVAIESSFYFYDIWNLAISLKGDVSYGNSNDIWARTLTFEVIEDATWGHAYQILNQTGEASL